MKKIRNLVIGGIENKIFNLIIFTVLLLSAANLIVYLHHNRMLSRLASESSQKQEKAISDITSDIMDTVVTQNLQRANKGDALIVDQVFIDARNRVDFLADYAAGLFDHPDRYSPGSYAGPDPAKDGEWTAKVIYADGVNPSDPKLKSRLGLAASMTDMMINLCPSYGAANLYIALPEGAHLSVSDTSSSWFEKGALKSYDPRERGWYKKAVNEKKLIYTDGEWDANTGAYCLECAAPVYDHSGKLAAVIGTDIYLDDMQKTLQENTEEGAFKLLVNEKGLPVISPEANTFPLAEKERGKDLRQSGSEVLARVVEYAIENGSSGVEKGHLADGDYYVTASSISEPGWLLVTAFSQETAGKPEALLQEENRKIQQDSQITYIEKTNKSKQTALVLVIIITLLMLAAGIILGKRIVKPLNTITKRIAGLKEGNLEFKMEDSYLTGDEIEELARSFAHLSHKTVQYVETVKEVTAEKERISLELSLATQIQAAMLPHIVPAFPDRNEFDILGSMDPAKEVGGDFYDYFLIDDDHLCMIIADVSGKGVPAALFMMASKIILQSVAMLGQSPAQILTKTNEAICSNNEAEMFVTVWLGIMEISTGKLTAANAGHEFPAIKRPDGSFELLKDKHGFVLGGMEGLQYKEYEIVLEHGTKLFVYTDGVPEAADADHNMYGTESMLIALNEVKDLTPEEILGHVRSSVDDYVKDAEQFDDLTMLCLEYR